MARWRVGATSDKLNAVSVAVNALLLVATLAVGFFAIRYSYKASESALVFNKDQEYVSARSQIMDNAARMVALDRLADVRNGNQITMLGQQSDALIDQFGQENLRLTAATYRILAQFMALDTDDLGLARALADDALSEAAKTDDTLEQIRAERVLGDISAQEFDIAASKLHYDRAIELAKAYPEATSRFSITVESPWYTRTFAVLSLLLAVEHGAEPAEACATALGFWAEIDGPDGVYEAFVASHSLEVARRAVRLGIGGRASICGLEKEKALHLTEWSDYWLKEVDRSNGAA